MDSNAVPAELQCSRVCLCVFCGLPGAGKTTVAQAVISLTAQQGWRTAVLSYDDLIPGEAFHHKPAEEDDDDLPQTQTKWKLHRQAVLKCIEQFLVNPQASELPSATCQINSEAWRRCLHAARAPATPATGDRPPLVLLLDDNFYYPSMRYEVYQLARKHSLAFCQVYLHCPLEACLSRNQRRARPVPRDVIVEMAGRMERPDPERNLWERRSVALDTADAFSDQAGQKLMKLISAAFDNPLSPAQDDTQQKEADRLSCANSVVHQADQACRRLVSLAMQRAGEKKIPPDQMRSLAAHLNESKTTFLHNLRKQVLQGRLAPPGEKVDVEQVVRRAVGAFDRDQKEVMARFLMKEMQ